MQRQTRLKGTGCDEIAQLADNKQINKMIHKLFTLDNTKQEAYVRSILKKTDGNGLIIEIIRALQSISAQKTKNLTDSDILGGIYCILQFFEKEDQDPAVFITTLKDNETISSKMWGMINSDKDLLETIENAPDMKERVNDSFNRYDNEKADIKMIEELIVRIQAVKPVETNSFFSKLFKKDKDSSQHQSSKNNP